MRGLSAALISSLTPSRDHLELDASYKKLIRALVEASCSESKSSQVVKDVIAGKGGGLIACLHGKPGTGKTLTSVRPSLLVRDYS